MKKDSNNFDGQEESGEVQEGTSVLPPRSNVHQKSKKKIKVRIQYPLIRLLFAVFILLILLIPSYSVWKERNSSELEETTVIQTKSSNHENIVIETDHEALEETVQELEEKQTGGVIVDGIKEIEEVKEIGDVKEEIEEKKTEKDSGSTKVEKETEEYIIHTVKKGETLYSVSMNYFHNRNGENVIKKVNNLGKNGVIYEGQKLKIPR